MQVLNGSESEIVGALKGFGLCGYEARMYFTLLTIGEAKACKTAKKASVPQSKAYDVLESLRAKGFIELTNEERPRHYRAKVLEEVLDMTIRKRQKEIEELEVTKAKIKETVIKVAPLHRKYEGMRLFSPSYRM